MDINKSVSSLGLSCSNNVKGDETISKIEDLKDAVMCNIKTIDTDEKTMYESELLPQLSNIMKDAESSIPSLCDIENKLSKQNASLQSLYESFDAAITTHNDNINDLARKRGTLLSELKTNNSQQLHCNQTNIQSLQNKFHMFHNQSLQHISYLKTLIKQQATQNKLLQTQIENQNNLVETEIDDILKHCENYLDATEFELFVGAIFKSLGFKVEHCGQTHDGGIDLRVNHLQNGMGIVQVKQYRGKNKVGEELIRDLWGATKADHYNYSFMVTLGFATKHAKLWPQLKKTDLTVWERSDLRKILKLHKTKVLLNFNKLMKHYYRNKPKNKNNHNNSDTSNHKNNNNCIAKRKNNEVNMNKKQNNGCNSSSNNIAADATQIRLKSSLAKDKPKNLKSSFSRANNTRKRKYFKVKKHLIRRNVNNSNSSIAKVRNSNKKNHDNNNSSIVFSKHSVGKPSKLQAQTRVQNHMTTVNKRNNSNNILSSSEFLIKNQRNVANIDDIDSSLK